jgi:predicted HicB family RNase H-like nuclease
MAIVTYKGYTAELEVDVEDGVLHGVVMGMRDVITFEAETVPRVIEEFQASVDFYLDVCARRGQDPEKPYSGHFMLRVDPELHRRLAGFAARRRESLNSVAVQALTEYLAARGEPERRTVIHGQPAPPPGAKPRKTRGA